MIRRRSPLAAVLSLALIAPVGAAAAERPRFDTRVFALVPTPGYPAHAYVSPDRRVYEGTYTNPEGDTVPSRVLEFSRDGTLQRSWTVRGQDLSEPHGVQVATVGPDRRLRLLDRNPPRVLSLDRRTGRQRTVARFPAGVTPNYAAWGTDRALYVTDYTGATIWRVPPRGGTPQPWLRSPELDGGEFGTTSISLTADRRSFLVGQASAAGLGAGDPAAGRILRVPIRADGRPGTIERLYESRPLDGLDGFAIGRSGGIYVAMVLTNQLAVIAPDGRELERFPPEPLSGENGSPVPFDGPSSVRFLGTRMLVANQAFVTGDASRQAILDVEAGERGLKEYVPKPRTPRARWRRPGHPTTAG